MNTIKEKIYDKFLTLNAREKVLLFGALIAVVLFIEIEIIAKDLALKNHALQQEIQNIEQQNKMIDLLEQKQNTMQNTLEKIQNLPSFQKRKISDIMENLQHIQIANIEETNDGFMLNGTGEFDNIWNALASIENNKFLTLQDIFMKEDFNITLEIYIRDNVKSIQSAQP